MIEPIFQVESWGGCEHVRASPEIRLGDWAHPIWRKGNRVGVRTGTEVGRGTTKLDLGQGGWNQDLTVAGQGLRGEFQWSQTVAQIQILPCLLSPVGAEAGSWLSCWGRTLWVVSPCDWKVWPTEGTWEWKPVYCIFRNRDISDSPGQASLIFWNRLLSSEPGAWAVLERQWGA